MLAILLAFMARGIEDQDLDVIETQPVCEVNERVQVIPILPLSVFLSCTLNFIYCIYTLHLGMVMCLDNK